MHQILSWKRELTAVFAMTKMMWIMRTMKAMNQRCVPCVKRPLSMQNDCISIWYGSIRCEMIKTLGRCTNATNAINAIKPTQRDPIWFYMSVHIQVCFLNAIFQRSSTSPLARLVFQSFLISFNRFEAIQMSCVWSRFLWWEIPS